MKQLSLQSKESVLAYATFLLNFSQEQIREHRKSLFTFRPLYGVMPPFVDFTLYNAQRTEDVSYAHCYAALEHLESMMYCVQDWMYDRSRLVFLREIGEGEFGKVLLMRTKVLG